MFRLSPLVLQITEDSTRQLLLNMGFLRIFKMKLRQKKNVLQISEGLYSSLLSQLYMCIRQLCTNVRLLVKLGFGGSCI